jgi:alkylation response protein AidB-like acyl-CoA dehydrogenase
MFAEQPDETAFLGEARHWQARLADGGWAGITWPVEHGGRGLSPVHEIVWAQESAGFDLPVAIFGIGLGMGGPTVMTWGTDRQKQRWLEPLLRGEEIWCQLFSEPGAGSDVAGVSTRAVRDGDEWVVTGQKLWTSGAQYSRWGMLLARTNPTVPKHAGLSYFVIDMDQPGIEVRPLRQMTGGANFNEVFFDGARVHSDNMLGGEGLGWSVATTTLMNERLSIGRILIGSSGVFASVRRMLSDLDSTGDDSTGDGDARRVIDLYVRGEVLRFMTQRLVTKFARGEIPSAEGSATKLGLTAMLEALGNLVVDAQGAAGMLSGRDARDAGTWELTFLSYPGLKVAGGTDEVMKNLIAERVLGLPGEPRVDKDRPYEDLPR